jgi:hypothetical protein
MSSSYDAALVDVAMIEDHRLLTLPRGVRLLHLEALVWSKAHLTDGYIPAAALNRLTDEPDAHLAAKQLARVGMWDMTDAGWRIRDFLDTQMSAERVRAKRQAARERYDRWQTSPKRVTNTAANGPARPAPPARKGGGQVSGNGAGLGKPAPAAMEVVPVPEVEAPTRRDLGRMIREAPNPGLRRAYISAFRKTWGHVYPEHPSRTTLSE